MAKLYKKGTYPRPFRWVDKIILCVEDQEVNHILIDRMLQKTSVQLLWAMDGVEAVELCKTNPDIDLILMDIMLPRMDGYEATRQIRKFYKKVPIIAQTAYVTQKDKHKVIDAGCDDLITKPFSQQILLDAIGKYLNPS